MPYIQILIEKCIYYILIKYHLDVTYFLVQIRLNKNYRSTRCIVEAASSLIQNNAKRCQLKNVLTDNSSGSKVLTSCCAACCFEKYYIQWFSYDNPQIVMKECHNEDAQCAFVVDKILEISSNHSSTNWSYGNIAVLYRRQVMFLDIIITMHKSNYPISDWVVFATSFLPVSDIGESLPNGFPG